ncbi:MAG: NAD(P)-dependent oxidoreductase [Elusimicrobia bacterium]|nr:NAD(P)-dependent oxidoreductase [Elusimicrobiota bacterium]
MKKAVVFGGSGFLGSHVADALTEAGYAVRIFDRAPSPYLQEGQEMIVGDVLDAEATRRAAAGCSYIYNFAAIADIDDARRRPVETMQVNVVGNVNILEAARKAKAERFVLASSVYVYSNSGSFYRVSKQACEQAAEVYHDEFGLSYTILRYGSLYGRRCGETNAVWKLLQMARAEGRVRYGGTGDELREYIHVSDAARLSVEILKPEYANLPIILTGHQPMRVRDLLEMIREMLGGKVKVELGGEPNTAHYNITPYVYHPRLGKKLVGTLYTDMGQGLMDILTAMSGEKAAPHKGLSGPGGPGAPLPRPKKARR